MAMDQLNAPRIWFSRALLILIFLNLKSNSMNLSDLKRVCVYYFLFDTNNTFITKPANFCTAVATYSKSGEHPPYKDFDDDLVAFKGDLPYVYINDEVFFFDDWKSMVKHDELQHTVDAVNAYLDREKVDSILFDIPEIQYGDIKYSEGFQTDMKSFLDKVKEAHKNVLLGLRIEKDVKRAKKVYNPEIINNSTDYYVIRSYNYNRCVYKHNQKNMAQPATPEQLDKTLMDFKDAGFDSSKIFLTIELIVKSFKKHQRRYHDWSYSWLCQSHPGHLRKFCRGTLENFYQQGKEVFDLKVPGVFIEATDCDDFNGHCRCGNFSASQAILEGMNGEPESDKTSGCKTFALLPEDRSP